MKFQEMNYLYQQIKSKINSVRTLEINTIKGFEISQTLLNEKNSPGCLGFAPRSESFAIEPSVQVCSISSLSGLTSCRPSANPLNPHKAFKVFTIRLLKTIEPQGLIVFNCRRRDLNPHGFPHTPLKRARIPIPPLRLIRFIIQFSIICFLRGGCCVKHNPLGKLDI